MLVYFAIDLEDPELETKYTHHKWPKVIAQAMYLHTEWVKTTQILMCVEPTGLDKYNIFFNKFKKQLKIEKKV